MSRIYFSVDIETDGVVAGRNNMLSLGACAIDMETGDIISKFKRNLSLVYDLQPDKDTMNWWKTQPAAYVAARKDAQPPSQVMREFALWVYNYATADSIIFAWKPVMDLAFVRYYIHRFHPSGEYLTIHSIFGRQGFGLDQKTVAALALKQTYRKTKMDGLPNSVRLNDKNEVIEQHSHDALEDAVEQAHIFWNCVRRLGVEL
jgi:3' exoribonuclease, RNase T-like